MSLPSVFLHDHLDGGLRPETIIELAEEAGYASLPSYDIGVLYRAGFNVQLNSATASMNAAFCGEATIKRILEQKINPGFSDV